MLFIGPAAGYVFYMVYNIKYSLFIQLHINYYHYYQFNFVMIIQFIDKMKEEMKIH